MILTMIPAFSDGDLYYFKEVTEEGGMSWAAEKLNMAKQTISLQVYPPDEGLVMTDAGRVAMQQADQIFRFGEHLPARVRDTVNATIVRLAMEITDGLPALVVHRLLSQVVHEPDLYLPCHEGAFDRLPRDLALRRLDIVLSNRPTRLQHSASQPSCRLLRHHFVCHANRPTLTAS